MLILAIFSIDHDPLLSSIHLVLQRTEGSVILPLLVNASYWTLPGLNIDENTETSTGGLWIEGLFWLSHPVSVILLVIQKDTEMYAPETLLPLRLQ